MNQDESFELDVISKQEPDNHWLQLEIQIVIYLQSLGVQMKTDPLAKQESYNKRKQFFKCNSAQFENALQQLNFTQNGIRSRRQSTQSSPLVPPQDSSGNGLKSKSIFSTRLDNFESYANEDVQDDTQDYFQNL